MSTPESAIKNPQQWGIIGKSNCFYVHIPNGMTEVYQNAEAYYQGNTPLSTLCFADWMDLKEEEDGFTTIINDSSRKEVSM